MRHRRPQPKPKRQYAPRPDARVRKIPATADILHFDDSIIVVNKPPRVSLDLDWDDQPTVLNQLETSGRITNDEVPIAAYMLEPRISGLAILARNDAVLAALHNQIAGESFVLTCLALVRGRAETTGGTIDQPVCERSRTNPLLRIDPEAGRPAITKWQTRDTFVGSALLECTTQPADPNQIRVHLQYVGMPLMVDPSYGGGTSLMLSSFKAGYRPSNRHPERPLIDRISMHVQRLSLSHPVSGEHLTFEAETHKDFRAALHQLDRYGRLPAI